jgi:hypothetical protein
VKQKFDLLSSLVLAYLFSGKISSSEVCLSFINPTTKVKNNLIPNNEGEFSIVSNLLENSNRQIRRKFARIMVHFILKNDYFQIHRELNPLEINLLYALKQFMMTSNYIVLCRSFAHLLVEDLISKVEILILTEQAVILMEVVNEIISAEMVDVESEIMKKVKGKLGKIIENLKNQGKVKEIKQELAINSSVNHISGNSLLQRSLEISKSKIKSMSNNSFLISEKVIELIDVAQYML